MPPDPPHTWFTAPAFVGKRIPTVVLTLTARSGDRITLVGAEPVGTVDGADVQFWFSPPVVDADGTRTIGEDLRPLVGAAFDNPTATAGPVQAVGSVAELTPQ